jgi:alkyl hydroperoxide reductase subunit AhpC
VEALQERFFAANTQVLGISIDSVYCHLNWAMSLGGISFPLLADIHPRVRRRQPTGSTWRTPGSPIGRR